MLEHFFIHRVEPSAARRGEMEIEPSPIVKRLELQFKTMLMHSFTSIVVLKSDLEEIEHVTSYVSKASNSLEEYS